MAKENTVTLSHRLARFGLADRESDLRDLHVESGARVLVSADNRHYAQRFARVPVTSARDLKQWLGVPTGAVGQHTPVKSHTAGFVSTDRGFPLLPFPAVPLLDPELHANLVSYLLSTAPMSNPTDTERKLLASLDSTISQLNIAIALCLTLDIHVEEGATLVFDKSVQSLVANHIVIENGATIVMESPFARIDCTGMRFVQS